MSDSSLVLHLPYGIPYILFLILFMRLSTGSKTSIKFSYFSFSSTRKYFCFSLQPKSDLLNHFPLLSSSVRQLWRVYVSSIPLSDLQSSISKRLFDLITCVHASFLFVHNPHCHVPRRLFVTSKGSLLLFDYLLYSFFLCHFLCIICLVFL